MQPAGQPAGRRLFKCSCRDRVTILAPEGALSQADRSNHLVESAIYAYSVYSVQYIVFGRLFTARRPMGYAAEAAFS